MGTIGKVILGTGIFGLVTLGIVSPNKHDTSNHADKILEEAWGTSEVEFLANEEETVRVTSIEENCHPSYSGCLDPSVSDYDCAGGSGNGPLYTGPVQVFGYDEFDLDRDGDGWGCE